MRHQAQIGIVGEEGQRKISSAKILIVGIGALGSVAAELLCRAGVGNITLCDYDFVEESNLQRQALYTTADIGRLKVEAAKEHLIAIDPLCLVSTIPEPFSAELDLSAIDIIIDGTDSLQARLVINDAAKKAGVALIIGAASGATGMVFTTSEKACWQCVIDGKIATDNCESAVLGPITHAIASLQATAAIRSLLGNPILELMVLDAWNAELRKIVVKRNKTCEACNGNYQHLSKFTLEFCEAKGKLQARPSVPKVIDLEQLRREENVERNYDNALLIKLEQGTVLVHRFGTLEFNNIDVEKAKRFSDHIYRKIEKN
jgi:molybdopterin-synthase adenylyltransferase